MTTTYKRLKDDTWGLRIEGPKPVIGSTVTVTTKAGKEKQERIRAIVWSGDGVHLCAIEAGGGQ